MNDTPDDVLPASGLPLYRNAVDFDRLVREFPLPDVFEETVWRYRPERIRALQKARFLRIVECTVLIRGKWGLKLLSSLPVAYRLNLPKDWAADRVRRKKAHVPRPVPFATKPPIALEQLEALRAAGAPVHCVIADAGYGMETAFRLRLSEMGFPYLVGVKSTVSVWPEEREPLPPKPYGGRERPPLAPRRTPKRQPVSVQALAQSLPSTAFQSISWREGTNDTLSGRFALARVRHAGGNLGRARLWPQQWLLIE